jgi:hypothetical protein
MKSFALTLRAVSDLRIPMLMPIVVRQLFSLLCLMFLSSVVHAQSEISHFGGTRSNFSRNSGPPAISLAVPGGHYVYLPQKNVSIVFYTYKDNFEQLFVFPGDLEMTPDGYYSIMTQTTEMHTYQFPNGVVREVYSGEIISCDRIRSLAMERLMRSEMDDNEYTREYVSEEYIQSLLAELKGQQNDLTFAAGPAPVPETQLLISLRPQTAFEKAIAAVEERLSSHLAGFDANRATWSEAQRQADQATYMRLLSRLEKLRAKSSCADSLKRNTSNNRIGKQTSG